MCCGWLSSEVHIKQSMLRSKPAQVHLFQLWDLRLSIRWYLASGSRTYRLCASMSWDGMYFFGSRIDLRIDWCKSLFWSNFGCISNFDRQFFGAKRSDISFFHDPSESIRNPPKWTLTFQRQKIRRCLFLCRKSQLNRCDNDEGSWRTPGNEDVRLNSKWGVEKRQYLGLSKGRQYARHFGRKERYILFVVVGCVTGSYLIWIVSDAETYQGRSGRRSIRCECRRCTFPDRFFSSLQKYIAVILLLLKSVHFR